MARRTAVVRGKAVALTFAFALGLVGWGPTASASGTSASGWPAPAPSNAPSPRRPSTNSNGDAGLAIARNQDGRLEAFCSCGPAGTTQIMHTYQVRPNGGWAPWESWRSAVLLTFPQVVMNRDGRLEMFFSDGFGIWHAWQNWAGGPWSGIVPLTTGGSVTTVAATKQADGRLELFFQCNVCGLNSVVKHIWQQQPGTGWSEVESLSPVAIPVGANVAFQDADGAVELLSLGGDSPIAYMAKYAGNVWSFSVVPSPGPSSFQQLPPEVGINADGRAEIFVATMDGIFNMWQTSPSGAWSGFSHLTSTPYRGASVARNPDGRLELFLPTTQGEGMHQWQVAPGASWSGPAPFTNRAFFEPIISIGAVNNADGRIEAFFLADNTLADQVALLHTWQLRRNLGPWTELVPL